MNDSTKMRHLESLAKALIRVTGNAGSSYSVRKDPHPELAWEGPYDWIMISGGSSVFSGETGIYSTPTEPEIQKVIDRIEDAGGYLEPANHYTMHIGDLN